MEQSTQDSSHYGAQKDNLPDDQAILIVFEGIDCTGKQTQASRLHDYLSSMGYSVGLIGFPQYGNTNGAEAVSSYLNGALGDVKNVPAMTAAILYAVDRTECLKDVQSMLAIHDFVIMDRGVASNAAYQAAKMEDVQEWLPFFHKLRSLEYGTLQFPRPDLTFLLDADASQVQARLQEKIQDLHERDLEYLQRVSNAYRHYYDVFGSREDTVFVHQFPDAITAEDDVQVDPADVTDPMTLNAVSNAVSSIVFDKFIRPDDTTECVVNGIKGALREMLVSLKNRGDCTREEQNGKQAGQCEQSQQTCGDAAQPDAAGDVNIQVQSDCDNSSPSCDNVQPSCDNEQPCQGGTIQSLDVRRCDGEKDTPAPTAHATSDSVIS